MTIELGKIKAVKLGSGGYQDAMFGVTFWLGGDNGWGTGDFWGFWDQGIKPDDRSEWTENDRRGHRADVFTRLETLMRESKVDDFAKLVGKPVEVTFSDMRLVSWRILKEVI